MKKIKIENDPVGNSPTMSADNSRSELQEEQAVHQVFSNDMLREIILGHVIYPTPSTSTVSNPQINYKDIPNLRLVEKRWLQSTSRILRLNRHSLYHLHNQNTNHVVVKNAEEHNRHINSFIQTMTQPQRSEPLLPTFRLDLICAFFVPENHKVLSDLFEKCGSGLVSLNMVIPQSCTMPFVFSPISLQILKRLTIEFASHSHIDPDDEVNPSFQENSSVTYFIQELVNSTIELQSVELKCCSYAGTDPSVIPTGLEFLSLPPTVSTLLLRGPFTPDHLEITAPRNQIAHLTTLQIRAPKVAPFLNENTIYKVLERHGSTIETLKLSGGKHFPRSQNNENLPSLFNIPPMKNLQTLSLTSINWQCVDKFVMTSINFPKLTTLQMKGISVTLFETITVEAKRLRTSLRSVENLEIWLVNQRFGFTVTINLDRMQRVHRTFQAVTNLDITICGAETCGLKYIFREMGHLKNLTINVRHGQTSMTCAAWDGLLIGAPEWTAKGLKENPDYWEYFKGEAGYDNNPSIMNLKALSKLTLKTINMGVVYADRSGLLSEVAIKFALLKMPELRILQLFGKFHPNRRMIKLWKNGKVTTGLGEPLVYSMNHGLQ